MAKKTKKKATKKKKVATKKKATPKTSDKEQKPAKKKKAKKAVASKTPAKRKAKLYRTPTFTADNTPRKWFVYDVKDKSVGRAASEICKILRGKHKATYSPDAVVGDFVIAINADKVKFTGQKWSDKKYYRYSGFLGGQKEMTAEKLHQKNPTLILQHAVKGMLPHNPYGRTLLTKLRIYAGSEHPHQGQTPDELQVA